MGSCRLTGTSGISSASSMRTMCNADGVTYKTMYYGDALCTTAVAPTMMPTSFMPTMMPTVMPNPTMMPTTSNCIAITDESQVYYTPSYSYVCGSMPPSLNVQFMTMQNVDCSGYVVGFMNGLTLSLNMTNPTNGFAVPMQETASCDYASITNTYTPLPGVPMMEVADAMLTTRQNLGCLGANALLTCSSAAPKSTSTAAFAVSFSFLLF